MPIWIIIAYGVVSAFCIFAAVRLFVQGKNAYAKAALGSYVFYTVVLLAVWMFRITVAPAVLFLPMLAVFSTCLFGHYLDFYTKSRVFDRYLHAYGTFSFALLSYFIIDDYVGAGGSKLFRAIVVFLLGNTIGVLFELFEMAHDMKKPEEPKTQKGLRDTDMDMLFNALGSVLAGVIAYLLFFR